MKDLSALAMQLVSKNEALSADRLMKWWLLVIASILHVHIFSVENSEDLSFNAGFVVCMYQTVLKIS